MKCQFCNKEKVDRVFYINWMGTVYQVPVCRDCLQNMWNQAVSSGKAEEFKNYTGWWPGKQEPRHLGDRAFPETAVPGLIKRRKLAALRVRLNEAAAAAFLAIVPVCAVFLFLQKYFISGLSEGSVK